MTVSLTSFSFFIFLPAAALVSFLCPSKLRVYWLLAVSYVFYMSMSPVYALVLLASTVSTFVCGLLVEKAGEKKGRAALILTLCLVFNLGMLFWFKYAGFALKTIAALTGSTGSALADRAAGILQPVGISFYTLQVIGYLIDCFRHDKPAERNFARYALFVSFFPQVVSGPIERYGHMRLQYEHLPGFSARRVLEGLQIMLWGYFLKMVLADRMAIYVDRIYESPERYSGVLCVIAVLLYSLQIYCDFFGYTSIAVGTAKVMGVEIMENFDAPYLSQSVSQFWRKWHISLSSWLRDYVYIPLGGNRKGTLRKYLNILIVFAVSGLWHGAEWSFVIWGLIHGAYQVTGAVLKPARDRLAAATGMKRDAFSHRVLRIAFGFCLYSFAWIFFRAKDTAQAIRMIGCLSLDGLWKLNDGTLYTLGLDRLNWQLMTLGIFILIGYDVMRSRGIRAGEMIRAQETWFKWAVWIIGLILVLTCGIWGPGYDAASFIYSQF